MTRLAQCHAWHRIRLVHDSKPCRDLGAVLVPTYSVRAIQFVKPGNWRHGRTDLVNFDRSYTALGARSAGRKKAQSIVTPLQSFSRNFPDKIRMYVEGQQLITKIRLRSGTKALSDSNSSAPKRPQIKSTPRLPLPSWNKRSRATQKRTY